MSYFSSICKSIKSWVIGLMQTKNNGIITWTSGTSSHDEMKKIVLESGVYKITGDKNNCQIYGYIPCSGVSAVVTENAISVIWWRDCDGNIPYVVEEYMKTYNDYRSS